MRYQIHKGCKYFGANMIFEDIQFEIRNNEKIAVIGRNGCGKTTLLKIMAGLEELDRGNIHKENNTSIGYLAQTTFRDETHTVQEELETAFLRIKEMQKRLDELTEAMTNGADEELLNKYANLAQAFEEAGGYTYEAEMRTVLTKFNFSLDDLNRTIDTFSGGQKTRLAFVKLLLSKPDILLLDEPTNHLDLDTIEWLEGYVKRYPKAVVLVSHDRMFLDDVVDVVYELEYGVMRRYPGNYTNYQNVKQSDIEKQKSAYARQQKEIARLEELIEKFRYKKNKAAFAQSKIKYLDRMEKIEDPSEDTHTFHARFTPKVKGGKRVLEVKNLVIGYDEPLCSINLEIMQGEKVAVLGPNGKGKSTFVKTIMGQVASLGGDYLYGHQIEPGYFDQELAQFHSNKTVLEEVWDEYDTLTKSEVRTILGSFLFQGEDVLKTVDCLSGGEKVRLSLVKLVLKQPNFLVLDEPTNHLDLLGKEALEDSLKGYTGTMLFVSHDRYFISKIATAILVIDEGKALYYPLNYQEYMERKKNVAEPEIKETVTQKQKPVRMINYGKEIKKLEKQIDEKEAYLEELRERRFEPEYYHDFRKMNELDQMIDDVHNEIEHLMELWETYSEMIS
ncbi:MAG: ABC-F type ribosomal protection protein [Erysipelotrichaceae bacterium]|nr:ABC-F type ribosomal protection protein [Erysipelotrichaceae bacterium]